MKQQPTIIEAKKRWGMAYLREIWAYRELFWVLVERDLRVRYKQTVLGVAWILIQPVASMLVFTFVFGKLAGIPSDGHPYAIFVFTALLPWTLFSASVQAASNSVVGSAQMVSKIYFPRLIIPLASIGSNIVNFLISSVLLVLLMWYYDMSWHWELVLLPLLLLGILLTTLGIGVFLAALTVLYRDFRNITGFLLQLWFYLTPVVYPSSLVAEKWQWLMALNPMVGLIESFRAIFLGSPLNVTTLCISSTVALLCFLFGVVYFNRVEPRFADVI